MADDDEYSLFGGSIITSDIFKEMMDKEHEADQQEAQLRLTPRIGPENLPYRPSPPLQPEPPVQLPTPPRPTPGAPNLPPPPGPGEPPLAPMRRLPTPPRPRFEASVNRPNAVPSEQEDMRDMGRSFINQEMEERRIQNERGRIRTPEEMLDPPPEAPPPRPGNKLAAVEPTGQNPVSAERNMRVRQMEEFRNQNEGPAPIDPMDVRKRVRTAQNRSFIATDATAAYNEDEPRSPDAAYQNFRQGVVDATNSARTAAENAPPQNPWRQFAGEFLSGAMSLLPPGAGGPRGGNPRGTPFARSIPRDEGVTSPVYRNDRTQPEQIRSAASRYKGVVQEGVNHGETWEKHGSPEFNPTEYEDGHTTTHHRFVSKQEAMEIADRHDQITPQRRKEMEAGGDAWNYRLNSEDLKMNNPPRHGANENRSVDEELGIPPHIARRMDAKQGAPTKAQREELDKAATRTSEPPMKGEYGPEDSALRGVTRRQGTPQEEVPHGGESKNVPKGGAPERGLGIFPEGYHDRVPSTRRMSGAGISHPGARWEIVDKSTNTVVATYMNKIKASRRSDKLDNTYGSYNYRVEPVRAREDQLTSSERSYLQKYEIDFNRKKK